MSHFGKYSVLAVIILMIMLPSCKSSKKMADSKNTKSSYAFNFDSATLLDNVLQKAAKQNKLIYMDISAVWCAPCQLMKRDVYTHEETADYFNKNFITYLVDAEKGEGPDLKLIFEVVSYPTLLIIDSRGRVISKREGSAYHADLINFGKEGIAKYKSGSN